ncbi:M23 family metallopeptidase [Arthrobacter sp. APC 3897]|uniref:M23 family metallopeptidase n=1 Tax=Arthrobacter sp. APC 3897 TaxID=3035204 RepID=UPI0025B3491A|nr:M23 family metallopeptidase [Arthrobacter sp. APC 3897]MDN3481582.1 M23 family metallopeptidase [Arthrobacter sp. APC 3897]
MKIQSRGWSLLVALTLLPVPAAVPFEVLSLPSAAERFTGGTARVPTGPYEPAWSWPLSPAPQVIRAFRAPPQRWLAGHRGVDLAAVPGAPVLSPAAGTVVFAGWVVDRPVMTVDLGGGLLASFEPVDASLSIGDPVTEGEVVGLLAGAGASGHCARSCLHWGVRLDGEYVNPLDYVTDRRPSVLLPLRRSPG